MRRKEEEDESRREIKKKRDRERERERGKKKIIVPRCRRRKDKKVIRPIYRTYRKSRAPRRRVYISLVEVGEGEWGREREPRKRECNLRTASEAAQATLR
jgi:dsRNA-specific ribonuclease